MEPTSSSSTDVQLPHSGLGIVSLVISIVVTVGVFVMLVVAGYMERSGLEGDSPAAMVVRVIVIGAGVALVVGVGLGLAGAFQRQRRRVLAILGLVINGGALILLGVVLTAGRSMS